MNFKLPFRSTKQRTAAAIPWLAVALVLFLALLGVDLLSEHRQHSEKALTSTKNLTQALGLQLNANFEQIDGGLRFVDQMLQFVPSDMQGFAQLSAADQQTVISQRLAALKKIFPGIEGLFVFDAEGRQSYSSIPFTTPISIADRPHFQLLRDNPEIDTTFSDIIIARTTGTDVISQIRARRDADGNFQGIIGAVIPLENINRLLAALDPGPGGAVLLRRSDTTVLIARQPAYDPADFNQPLPPDNPIYQRIAAGERQGELTYTASPDGIKRLGSFQVLDNFPFYVQAAMAQSHYLAGWRQRAKVNMAIAFLLGFGFLMVARHLHKSERARQAAMTELRASEQKLAEFSRDVEAFLDFTTDFVYFKDEHSRIRFCSQAMAKITGHTDWREMIGKHDREIFPPETARIYQEEESPVFSRGIPLLNKINPYYDELGRIGYVQTNKWPLFDARGKVVGIFGISRDITAQKKAQEALARSNAELEQFAYAASHDLRQPLRMINSYIKILIDKLGGQLEGETREMMHFAADGASRMDKMLIALLEYSRMGRLGEPIAPVDSREMAREAINYLQPLLAETSGRVELIGDWPVVEASYNEGVRLFQNLIGNALKYRAPERPPVVMVEVRPGEHCWEFSVRDNGIGIDPAQFSRLFKVFQRLHNRERYEGTGVGLAMARKIVERHGGRIWVDSRGEGKGSTFIFTLPRSGRDLESEAERAAPK
ncbi:ATP-binding protein [Desulfurivibrio alkaliphilus]|uniref:histidine kinase n=1 Tax=Desulfurivibrio alkaliphilus (strain DSM 19089 / UNIQEM U267 / AHT2) TaxID=589865 RepID=D6Z1C5_DESAT|nr:ATP-binding protein [Desulfurivibrio alkaliphilus]ADH85380.1 multi-sensor signal transduction histidine kinase [Desulfurivibrio alkaliphilus AHT 2]